VLRARGDIEQSPERGLGLTNEYVAFHWDHAVIRASSTKFLTVLASRGTSAFLPQFGLLPQVSVPLQKMGGPPAAWDAPEELRLCEGDQLKTEFLCFARNMADGAFLVLALISILSDVDIGFTKSEEPINQQSQLVGCGHNGFFWP